MNSCPWISVAILARFHSHEVFREVCVMSCRSVFPVERFRVAELWSLFNIRFFSTKPYVPFDEGLRGFHETRG